MHSKLGRKNWLGCLLIVILLAFQISCSRDKKNQDKSGKKDKSSFFSKSSKKDKIVSVMTPTIKEIPIVIKTSGKTEVSEKYEAKAPAAMKVTKVFVEEGAKIQPGDPLVQFDEDTIKLKLNLVRAEIKEAEAALANINYLIQNKEKLLQEEKISETEAEGFDSRQNWYQATEERAKAEIDLYEHTGDMSQINSPIGGFVTFKGAEEGVEVVEDQKLIEVVRMDPIHFSFSVTSDEAAALAKVQSIVIKFPTIPNQDFSAEMVSIGAEAKAELGGFPVKLKISNPEYSLKGDMAGDVLIKTQANKKAFVVPESVLKKSDKSYFIFKLEDGKAKKVFVELAETPSNGNALVVKGISEKDALVAESDMDIKDGDILVTKIEEKKP